MYCTVMYCTVPGGAAGGEVWDGDLTGGGPHHLLWRLRLTPPAWPLTWWTDLGTDLSLLQKRFSIVVHTKIFISCPDYPVIKSQGKALNPLVNKHPKVLEFSPPVRCETYSQHCRISSPSLANVIFFIKKFSVEKSDRQILKWTPRAAQWDNWGGQVE